MSANLIADGAATLKRSVYDVQVKLKGVSGVPAPSVVQKESLNADDAAVGVAEKSPVRRMDHISDSYDAKGNLVTKYMDSSNHVIYQTPSDSVLKAQEFMSKFKKATNTKA